MLLIFFQLLEADTKFIAAIFYYFLSQFKLNLLLLRGQHFLSYHYILIILHFLDLLHNLELLLSF